MKNLVVKENSKNSQKNTWLVILKLLYRTFLKKIIPTECCDFLKYQIENFLIF